MSATYKINRIKYITLIFNSYITFLIFQVYNIEPWWAAIMSYGFFDTILKFDIKKILLERFVRYTSHTFTSCGLPNVKVCFYKTFHNLKAFNLEPFPDCLFLYNTGFFCSNTWELNVCLTID